MNRMSVRGRMEEFRLKKLELEVKIAERYLERVWKKCRLLEQTQPEKVANYKKRHRLAIINLGWWIDIAQDKLDAENDPTICED